MDKLNDELNRARTAIGSSKPTSAPPECFKNKEGVVKSFKIILNDEDEFTIAYTFDVIEDSPTARAIIKEPGADDVTLYTSPVVDYSDNWRMSVIRSKLDGSAEHILSKEFLLTADGEHKSVDLYKIKKGILSTPIIIRPHKDSSLLNIIKKTVYSSHRYDWYTEFGR